MENAGLMIDQAILNGVELQAEAMWEDEMFNHHVHLLENQIAAQEEAIAWAAYAEAHTRKYVTTLIAGRRPWRRARGVAPGTGRVWHAGPPQARPWQQSRRARLHRLDIRVGDA